MDLIISTLKNLETSFMTSTILIINVLNDLDTFIYLLFAIINCYSFLIMGLDKYLAQNNKRRKSEFHLMISALIGGAIGVYLGMKLFRHKTKRLKFSLGIPILILVNIVMYYLLTTKMF